LAFFFTIVTNDARSNKYKINKPSGYTEALNFSTGTETTGLLRKTMVVPAVKVILIPSKGSFTLYSNSYTS